MWVFTFFLTLLKINNITFVVKLIQVLGCFLMNDNFFHKIIFIFSYIALCCFFTVPLQARWGTPEEATIECLESFENYKISEDGTWEMVYEEKLKILTEQGRQDFSVLNYRYDATRTQVKVLEAETIHDGKVFSVSTDKIEDKPLASDPTGIREERQILIPLQHVNVGSIVRIKVKMNYFKPDVENYFATKFAFSEGVLWKNSTITIDSALPLVMKVNDPLNALNVREEKKGNRQLFTVTLTRPLFQKIVGESQASFLDPVTQVSISFSTEKDYERISQSLGKRYAEVLKAPLPGKLQEIRELAQNAKSETECINKVVSHLIKSIHYLGSWNSADGHYIPRPLQTIIETGYGDCKEFSACLAAILKSLGYQAHVAVVQRELVYLEDEGLPGLQKFNHAIVKAVSPQGQVYWLDPTNLITMADGIFPDIADRSALVLTPEGTSQVEHIPAICHRHARKDIKETITLKDDGSIHTEGSLCMKGEEAHLLTEDLIRQPTSVVRDCLIRDFCDSGNPVAPTLDLPEMTSNEVQTLTIPYSYGEKYHMIRTNKGYALPLKSHWARVYVEASPEDEGALFVGNPRTRVVSILVKDGKAENLEDLAFSVQSPWINAKREFQITKEGIWITETVERLKSVVLAKELKTKEFQALKEKLHEYCDGAALILSKDHP